MKASADRWQRRLPVACPSMLMFEIWFLVPPLLPDDLLFRAAPGRAARFRTRPRGAMEDLSNLLQGFASR